MRNFADLQAHVERKLKTTAGMIVVPKVYSTRLAERRYPTRGEIDSYSGGRAVMFDNGYTAALNSAALRAAGVSAQTPDPENGKVIRNRDGEPTGPDYRRAPNWLQGCRQSHGTPTPTASERCAQCKRHTNRVGLTSVIDRSQNADGLRAYQTLWRDGELTVRSYVTRTVQRRAASSPTTRSPTFAISVRLPASATTACASARSRFSWTGASCSVRRTCAAPMASTPAFTATAIPTTGASCAFHPKRSRRSSSSPPSAAGR